MLAEFQLLDIRHHLLAGKGEFVSVGHGDDASFLHPLSQLVPEGQLRVVGEDAVGAADGGFGFTRDVAHDFQLVLLGHLLDVVEQAFGELQAGGSGRGGGDGAAHFGVEEPENGQLFVNRQTLELLGGAGNGVGVAGHERIGKNGGCGLGSVSHGCCPV